MVGLGWQQNTRCGVMITVVVWFYRRVTVGGMAGDPGKWGRPLDAKSGWSGKFLASRLDLFIMKIRTDELEVYAEAGVGVRTRWDR